MTKMSCFTLFQSSLTNFPPELGCKHYSFLDQAVEDFVHGLDSILIDSSDTPEWDASFHEAVAMLSSVSLGFLHSVVYLIILGGSLLLASNFVNYGARLRLCFCLYQSPVKWQLLSRFVLLFQSPSHIWILGLFAI